MQTEIKYSKEYSEFEIQAMIYTKLREAGFDIRGEVYAIKCYNKSIFDLVFFDKNKKPVLIIEVKKRTKKQLIQKIKAKRSLQGILESKLISERRQIDKYSKYGLPVIKISGMKQAECFVLDFVRDWERLIINNSDNPYTLFNGLLDPSTAENITIKKNKTIFYKSITELVGNNNSKVINSNQTKGLKNWKKEHTNTESIDSRFYKLVKSILKEESRKPWKK